MPVDILALPSRIIAGGELTRAEARELFALDGDDRYDLFYAAHKVRRHFHGNRVTFCSIVASKFGNCSEDCKFCAQSAHFDTGIQPHPMMEAADVAAACRDARDRGASAFGIVNSGRGPTRREWPKIMEAVHAMKSVEGICHCATLGTLTEEQARDLKAAGIRRINHNLETSREFYPQIVTTHTWQERVETVRLAQRVGLEICCGCIFGMGESIDDRVSLAFSLKELNPHVVPLNFLHPIPGTPLAHMTPLKPLEILKIVAVMRLILPRVDLKVAGGREKNLRDLQSWIFYVGATSALIGNYLATTGRPNHEDLQMIDDLELTWHGDRVGDADPAPPAAAPIRRPRPLPVLAEPLPAL
ncbi:MAG: biotin synthase BioB [Gemmataceae bacterium]|nr:biotin synthase BioB [Gemmataceae bacterium]MDW8266845.1 biotin synthase BioB [Gemmataceae bacterium]